MIRKLVVNILYDYAKYLTYVADWLSPPCDNIWRERQRRLQQRPYQQFIPAHNCHESHASKH